MTACGGNLIGGEISRNEQCPLHADLRRLRLRIAQALAPLCIKVSFQTLTERLRIKHAKSNYVLSVRFLNRSPIDFSERIGYNAPERTERE